MLELPKENILQLAMGPTHSCVLIRSKIEDNHNNHLNGSSSSKDSLNSYDYNTRNKKSIRDLMCYGDN